MKRDFFQIIHANTNKATATPAAPRIIMNKKKYANPIPLTCFLVLWKYHIEIYSFVKPKGVTPLWIRLLYPLLIFTYPIQNISFNGFGVRIKPIK